MLYSTFQNTEITALNEEILKISSFSIHYSVKKNVTITSFIM